MVNQPYSVVITGEWPGAGQSTTAKLLTEKLGFKRVYAGELFRKFAHIWYHESQRLSWVEFEKQMANHQISLADYHFHENKFNEQILHQWQHQLKQVNTPEIWDKIVDNQSILALQQPGVVVEAKVGVLLDQTGLGTLDHLPHAIYKILLVCPPEIAAHRVIKRKIANSELQALNPDSRQYLDLVRQTTTEIINRHLRDWERYEKIYHIKRSDIYKSGILQIYTTTKEPPAVVDAIIQAISAARHKPKPSGSPA
ncbi:hypothetical protein A2W24_06345 [Microgenomates group bacterium RBG_16_45_19]|nr:MAG: hypothetical protein A2W24_06345 [Microgenomates group bacterium RBG_16_45_19]